MKEIDSGHKKAMMKIQTQADLEKAKHDEIMKKIEQQSLNLKEEGKIDIAQFSGNCTIKFDYP